ncbi:MAG: hypothetical protein RLZZ164_762 [Actinomycetota bacterium]|jgi:primosomal protein N' (replication factor Y)
MSQATVARVVLDTPLLSLDKLLDFAIPERLQGQVLVGSNVRVTVGRSTKQHSAYVVALADSSEFKLKELVDLNSPMPMLPTQLYDLLRLAADRSVCALGDLIKSALPNRMVRIEKQFENAQWASVVARKAQPVRSAEITFSSFSAMAERAYEAQQRGESVLLITPTNRQLVDLKSVLERNEIEFLDYSSEQTASARYAAFLTSQTIGAHVIVGTRSAIWAPAANLGLIAIFDEHDDNLTELTAPYLCARDVALLRSSISNCDLHFASASRSTDIQRLVDLGFMTDVTKKMPAPKIAFDPDTGRNSNLAYNAIREGLENGPVLVQVQGKGVARSAFCKQCATRATCKACSGPLWIDATNVPRCRWCNLQNLDFACRECHSTNLRQGMGGSTRTAAEFGKSFPGVAIVESAGEKIRNSVPAKKQIVIATPGAEPHVDGGYAAVVILDAWAPLHIDSLRATERALSRFCTAIALMSNEGRCVIAGVPAHLGQDLALYNVVKIARDELESRRELAFPPHLRLASLQGDIEQTRTLAENVRRHMPRVEVLGPIQLRRGEKLENRFILKFAYADGSELAKTLRSEIMTLSAGASVSASGRNQRAVRVRMDDAEVI